MSLPFLEFSAQNFTRSQFDTTPPADYVIPQNTQTGEKLPYCCANHKQFYEQICSLFDKFPNCCDAHREIAKNPLVKIDSYKNVPDKIINQCAYTQHHIYAKINSEDWWADITEYIEYNIFSFGHPNIGLEHYLNYIFDNLQDKNWLSTNKIPITKAKSLSEYITKCRNPSANTKDTTSLTILYSTYQKWIKIFPFELSFFQDLKENFEKRLPLLKETVSTNRYLMLTKARMHTKESLIEFLLQTTSSILSTINSLTNFKNWQAQDADRIKLELIAEQRKLKLKKGYYNNSEDEHTRYRKILKEWLKDEKTFINEIKPLLPNTTPHLPNSTQNMKPVLDIKTQQYKEELRGKPKEEKIDIINAELDRRGKLSSDDPTIFSPKSNQLEKLLAEINNNHEAYESYTKRRELIPYLCDLDLNWYLNIKNIPAQKSLVLPTYEYFSEGPGKDTFEILDFFNLLEKQYKVLLKNLDKPFDVLNNLKVIPLTEKERHILYGFLLKWFGGYPIQTLNEQLDIVLKLIQKEFLSFEGPTPEKEFCKADDELRKKLIKLSITGTTAMNTGVSWHDLFNEVDKETSDHKFQFDSFNHLYIAAYNNGVVGPFSNDFAKLANRDTLHLKFNLWIKKSKNWVFGDIEQYGYFLTKDYFIEFLNHLEDEKQRAIEENQRESATWGLKTPSSGEPTVTNTTPPSQLMSPIFDPEALQTVYDLLKGFFEAKHHIIFRKLLETGKNLDHPLIFLDNGNRLADSFKQLIKTDVITGCEQKELESWICTNFKYRYRQQINSFTLKYLNDIISTNKDLCKKPILNVKVDKVTGKILITKA